MATNLEVLAASGPIKLNTVKCWAIMKGFTCINFVTDPQRVEDLPPDTSLYAIEFVPGELVREENWKRVFISKNEWKNIDMNLTNDCGRLFRKQGTNNV
jgi:hypothetical protein